MAAGGTDGLLGGAARDGSVLRRERVPGQLDEGAFRAILNEASALFFVKDSSFRYVFVNRAFCRFVRRPADEVLGATDEMLLPGDLAASIRADDVRVLAGEKLESEDAVAGEGGLRTFVSLKFPLLDGDGRPYAVCGVSTDITDRQRDQQILRAQYGVAESMAGAEAFAPILKAVGVGLGWAFAARWALDPLSAKLRCVDVWSDLPSKDAFETATSATYLDIGEGLPGRVWESGETAWVEDLQGDRNFTRIESARTAGLHSGMAFPVFGAHGVLAVIELFSRAVQPPDRVLSDGVSTLGHHLGQFLERDSAARAKEDELRKELDNLAWLGRIRDALAEDRFRLYAQPIFDLSTNEITQHELLIRMVDRAGKVISPGLFLPAAERYGLVQEIDHWVIRRAVEIAASGQPVQLNLSAQTIGRPGLLSSVREVLAKTGADPRLLVFEVTETALMESQAVAEEFVRGIAELGCEFALDDFGTGFGSFIYLKNLPVDYLKIDIEFVRSLATDIPSQHVVRAVVGLAAGFNQKTVAEGVEDEASLALLREYGVDYAQGFHLGRPSEFAMGADSKAKGVTVTEE